MDYEGNERFHLPYGTDFWSKAIETSFVKLETQYLTLETKFFKSSFKITNCFQIVLVYKCKSYFFKLHTKHDYSIIIFFHGVIAMKYNATTLKLNISSI